MTAWHRSIRTRVGAALALSVLVACVALSWVVDRQVTRSGVEELRQHALDQLSVATAAYDFTATVQPGVSVDPADTPAPMRAQVRPGVAVTWYDGHTMWAERQVQGGHVLLVQVDDTGLRTRRAVLRRALLGAGAGSVLVASLVGWLVAGSLTSRLRRAAAEVERTARREAPGSRFSPTRARGDEVGVLVSWIEDLTRTVGDQLARERRFTADIAHELRTPVTVLVSAAELLPEGEVEAIVRRQTQRLRSLVEDLLDLARAEQAGELNTGRCDLGALVTEVAAEFDAVEVHLDHPATIETDPRRVSRIVTNLVANAQRHGRPPVEVTVAEATITVTDNGPGYPPHILHAGPHRFTTSGASDGIGLGLAITQTWATRLGATLHLTNRPTGGACATVSLTSLPPAAPADTAATPAGTGPPARGNSA